MTKRQLRVDAVDLSIGGTRIVDQASLAVRGGQMVGIIGRNGSGKSTLL